MRQGIRQRQGWQLERCRYHCCCEAFKNARREWERSEAFLYGAAANNEIDPHIDSWPLDHDQMVEALNKQSIISSIKGENPAQFIYTEHKYFESVIGFHGLEFVLFRNGAERTAAMLNANETEAGMTSVKGIDELAFAAAAAGDIYNMTSLLQYGWNGDATLGSWLTSNCNWVIDGLKIWKIAQVPFLLQVSATVSSSSMPQARRLGSQHGRRPWRMYS